MQEIKSYNELIEKIEGQPKAYLLLYKPGSTPNECAFSNIREAYSTIDDIMVLWADVSVVRDIHPNYPVTSTPSLLIFENGKFVNNIVGCNENKYYKTLFEDAQFARIRAENGKKMKSVTVYSTPTCTWCNTLKTYLRKNRIPFTDVDVSRDPNAAQELVRRTGQQGVPQTEIDGEVVVGFDKKRINDLLEING
jgi:glutaredoxin-like YruB-family protein